MRYALSCSATAVAFQDKIDAGLIAHKETLSPEGDHTLMQPVITALGRTRLAELFAKRPCGAAGVSPGTLNKRAAKGDEPLYLLFGRVPLYRWGNLIGWAKARTRPPAKREGAPTVR